LRAPSIKTSIATVSISGTFLEKLEAIAAARSDGMAFGATPVSLAR
jgi:hypothetical protein